MALLAAGPVVGVVAIGSSTAVAQGVVTTQQYTIGNGPVLDATAAAQPDTAGATANYSVGFKTPLALDATSGSITLSGSATTFPSAKADYFIVDDTSSSGDQPVGNVSVDDSGHSATVQLSSAVAAGSSLSVYVVGATNPPVAGEYSLDVSTSSNPTPASTSDYEVVAAAAAPTFAPVASPPLAGAPATYTVGAFAATAALAPGSTIEISSYAGAGADDNIGFPTSTAAYKVTDLTTGTTSVPQSVTVSASPTGTTGQVVSIQLGAAVASGDELSVTVTGVRNPTGTESDTLTAAAPAAATAASATLQIGTSVVDPTLAISQPGAGSTDVEYIAGFRTTSELPAGGTVTLLAPPGTSFAGARVTVVDATHASASANVPASSVKVSAGPSSSSANELTATLPEAVLPGDQLFVEVDGVTNPPAGDYGGSAGNFTIATSTDVIAASPPAYVITAASAPEEATIEVSSSVPGATAQYTIGDLKTTAALSTDSSTLQVSAPAGTTFPSNSGDYTVVDVTDAGASAHPVSVTGGGSSSVVLRLGANVPAGSFVELVADDVTNPPAGQYKMTLVGDIEAAVLPSTPVIVSPSRTTTTSLTGAPNPATVGQSVTYIARVAPVPSGGTVTFTDNGAVIAGCRNRPVRNGTATCSTTYWSGGSDAVQAFYSGSATTDRSVSAPYEEMVTFPAAGYWLVTRSGEVFGEGAAVSDGNAPTSPATGPVVGIAGTPSGRGYWVVTADGTVTAFGNAKSYGDLPSDRVSTSDITAIAPTANGHGYWLVGRDGGLFAFGNATFHGSVPGLHLHVSDIVGMVASPDGGGYLLVGADGGVFTFGSARFYGSLPGIHKHVHDIKAILPSLTGKGYVLVGADGGAFIFGKGVNFLGSLPGRGIKVDDIVGIALTPKDNGYFMAGADGYVYGFGTAVPSPMPQGLAAALPVVAIAGT